MSINYGGIGNRYPVRISIENMKFINQNLLWTGESVWCQCSHHVEHHKTIYLLSFMFHQSLKDIIFVCSFEQNCPCTEFMPYKEIQN